MKRNLLTDKLHFEAANELGGGDAFRAFVFEECGDILDVPCLSEDAALILLNLTFCCLEFKTRNFLPAMLDLADFPNVGRAKTYMAIRELQYKGYLSVPASKLVPEHIWLWHPHPLLKLFWHEVDKKNKWQDSHAK